MVTGLTLTIFALSAFEQEVTVLPLLAFAAGIGAIALYVRHARRAATPLVRLTMLAEPLYRRLIVSGSFFRLGTAALPFLASIALQSGHGADPAQTGLILSCSAFGAVCAKPLAYGILRRLGYRRTLLVNVGGTVAALLAISALLGATHLSMTVLAGLLLGAGFLRSVQFTALNSLNYLSVPRAEMGSATTLASIAQQLSVGIGVVLANLLMGLLGMTASGALLVVAALTAASAACLVPLERKVGDGMLDRP